MRKQMKIVMAAALLASAAGMATSAFSMAQAEQVPAATPVSAKEHARTIEAMRPPKRKRPVVAVVGESNGAETTDFLVPYGVLTQSGLADVMTVAPAEGGIQLRPSLKVQAQATFASFDQKFPDGADYIIVPAMRASPQMIAWIQAQAAKGATIVGICAGTMTLSQAGLLKDRAATGYWQSLEQLRSENPGMRWVPHRRFVADRGIVTTTGITASMPVSLALVEAIGGRAKADAVAREMGIAKWSGDHDSNAFGSAERQLMQEAFAKRAERATGIGIKVEEGVDEIALAFTADAFSRPFGFLALAVAPSDKPIKTKRGLMLLPDRVVGAENAPKLMIPEFTVSKPAHALDASLDKIAETRGKEAAHLVALQMEYPRGSFSH